MVYPFESPSTMIVNGPTQSGKTTWLRKLIDNKKIAFTKDPGPVHYYYGQWQSAYNDMEKIGVKFHEGLPASTEEIPSDSLIVLDDLQQLAVKSDVVENLFTRGSHHKNLTIIFLTQNLFQQGPKSRPIHLNCHYLVLFRSARDFLQIQNLASQMKLPFLAEAHEDATREPYEPLIIDSFPNPKESGFRIRAKVLDESPVIYSNSDLDSTFANI